MGKSESAPDSRSETLSPREWPTLEAARDHMAAEMKKAALAHNVPKFMECWSAHEDLNRRYDLQRRRRPRGESGPLTDDGGKERRKKLIMSKANTRTALLRCPFCGKRGGIGHGKRRKTGEWLGAAMEFLEWITKQK